MYLKLIDTGLNLIDLSMNFEFYLFYNTSRVMYVLRGITYVQYKGDSIRDPCCIFCREGRTYFRPGTVVTQTSHRGTSLTYFRFWLD